MNILFSPSEEKQSLLNAYPVEHIKDFFINLDYEKFLIKSSFRKEFILQYLENFSNFEHIFGIKNYDEILKMFSEKQFFAIELYSGVAFKALDFQNLSEKQQNYIKEKTIIFSNLFGPIFAGEKIPFYKLKQGVKLKKDGKNINPAKEYRNDCSPFLDSLMTDFCIDLRAQYYSDYYKIKCPFASFKFSKNNKIISHSSKLYRGKILKLCAQKNVTNLKEISHMIEENFSINKIEKIDNNTIFDIEIKD